MATKKLNREEAAPELREYARLGLSLAEQATRLGVSVRAIQEARVVLGLTTPRKPTVEITPEIDALLRQAIDDGWSRVEASRTTGISERRLKRDYPELYMPAEEKGVFGNSVRTLNRKAAGRRENNRGGTEPFHWPAQ